MEEYSTYGGLDRGIPLLCVCTHCGTIHVAFSQEFAFGRKDEAHSEYAKVYGHNRIFPGDWLYFDGATRPCIVKSFFQSRDREVVVYKRNGMPDEKYEGPKIPISHEVAPEGYRLLPAQCVNTLLGDHVYHVLRKQFGVAVGVVKDDTKAGILAIIERMKEENEIDGVILGCTELPLAVNAEELSVLCFDTMKIHIAAIVDEICS